MADDDAEFEDLFGEAPKSKTNTVDEATADEAAKSGQAEDAAEVSGTEEEAEPAATEAPAAADGAGDGGTAKDSDSDSDDDDFDVFVPQKGCDNNHPNLFALKSATCNAAL